VQRDRTEAVCVCPAARSGSAQSADDAPIRTDYQNVGIEESVMRCAEKRAIARIQPLGDRCLTPGDDVCSLKGSAQREATESAALPVSGQQRSTEHILRDPAVVDLAVDDGGFLRPRDEPVRQLIQGRTSLREAERVGKLVPGICINEPVSLVQVVDVPGNKTLRPARRAG
jgi:hypothetical protein